MLGLARSIKYYFALSTTQNKAASLTWVLKNLLTATLRANQLRLYFSAFAGVLLLTIRRLGLAGTHFARAQCGTMHPISEARK